MADVLLELQDLQTHFFTEDGIVKAVDGVSLQLREGECLGIVGESGSGKSVTAQSILQLIPTPPGRYVGGKILFRGQELIGLKENALGDLRGKKIAMIFQDPMTSLNPYLTVGTQLREVLERHESLSCAEVDKRCVDMMQAVGMSDAKSRLRAYPHEFSGGMRQRVMIAMALLCEPDVLIADEPTTALDVTVQAQILELMRELRKRVNTSIILITHDLGVVAQTCQRVAVMYAGRVVETGTTEDVFREPSHPYTRALLGSIPRLDLPAGEALEVIDGLPPDLSKLPSGCPFHVRCREATAECARTYPNESKLSADPVPHTASCHLLASELGAKPRTEASSTRLEDQNA